MIKFSQLMVFSIGVMACSVINDAFAGNSANSKTAHVQRHDKRVEHRAEDRKGNRQEYRQESRQIAKRVGIKPVPRAHKRVLLVPRKRTVRNVVVIRLYGHAYHGYGHFYHDNDAWKWLAFTAISLKILDNIDEASQRAHEAAQVKATTAGVGEKITWQTDSASGTVVTTKQGTNNQGQTCREFQQTVTIGGETEQAYGTACLQADGSWKMV